MRSKESQGLLNVRQASDLLQPYLPKISAYALLKKDNRRDNPLLGFSRVNGEVYYKKSDVISFLQTLLIGMEQHHLKDGKEIPLPSPNRQQARHAIDRRRLVERRSSVVTRLSEEFERRFDDNVARRSRRKGDRRHGFSDTH